MMPSRKVKPKAPAVYTKEEWSKFNPWWPRNFVYMSSLIFMTWGFILAIPNALAYLNGLPQYFNPFMNPKPAPPPNSPAAAHITTYPPWFFLFLYKIADFTSDVVVFLMIGVIIPLVYLIILPFIDRSDELHPLRRKVFTGIGILMITYLIQTSLWGDLAPGVEVSVKDQVVAYLIPAIIVALGLTFIKPMNDQMKLTRGISPMTGILFVIVSLLFAGSVVQLIDYPNLFTFAITAFMGSLFFLGSKTMGKLVLSQRIPNNAVPEVKTAEVSASNETKKKFAEILMSVLFILVVIIVAQMWTIPPTGYASNLFGVDLGLVFLMLGEVISLYHYVVYKKPIEKEE